MYSRAPGGCDEPVALHLLQLLSASDRASGLLTLERRQAMVLAVTLEPAHWDKRHARIDLAIPSFVDDPRLVTIRGQLVRGRPGQQDRRPNLNCHLRLTGSP